MLAARLTTYRAEEDIGCQADRLDGCRLQRDLHEPAQFGAERLNPAEMEEDSRATADVNH